ncbi:sugar phosphate isomerase/epimerase family protein [Paenibacillus sp. Y412MC10]|uniref:sugar phosphate isomerase/epimerase family protein n=1 Tax=Geobacillus sp. (strain Y412MC10) TaxID=481743 RepID=UPI00017885A0|nr:TIM barrel protein [Paenibacillus sp. Y412MC10]ACX66551.1 Xylose isomerase domain protein TIM barrel [Paenibacillus sp. Y412MC10]
MTQRRLQIGMWDQFTEERWERLADKHISGMEICSFPNREALVEVSDFCRNRRIAFGVHAPILREAGYRLPQVNAPEPEVFRKALEQISAEVRLASSIGADYMLFHYPFYPIFQEPFTPYPRLPSPEERYSYNQLGKERFREMSKRLFEFLCELQLRYGQRIVLEHDFFGDYGDVLIDSFYAYPDIGFVLDTARLDIARRAFQGFDPYPFLDRMASRIYLVHYSNVWYEKDKFTHHLPVLPEHDHDSNYGEAYAYLQYVAARNSRFHVTFEHNASLITRQQLQQIYDQTAFMLQEQGGHVLIRP